MACRGLEWGVVPDAARHRDDVSPVQYLQKAGLLDRHHVEALVSGEAEQKPEEVVA